MARFRALEAGRFLMRATSNGITAVIGPDGEVVVPHSPVQARSPEVHRAATHRPHALRPRTGNWPILSLAFLLLIAFAIHRVRTRHYA